MIKAYQVTRYGLSGPKFCGFFRSKEAAQTAAELLDSLIRGAGYTENQFRFEVQEHEVDPSTTEMVD